MFTDSVGWFDCLLSASADLALAGSCHKTGSESLCLHRRFVGSIYLSQKYKMINQTKTNKTLFLNILFPDMF